MREQRLFYGELEIIPESEIDETIQRIYTNPKLTGSRDHLFEIVKMNYLGISRRRIMAFLKKQESWQVRQPIYKPKVTQSIISEQPLDRWQVDLIDMQNYSHFNSGYKWILTCIDIFTKYLRAIPLKNKEGQTVSLAMRSILQVQKPKTIQSDNGSEFTSREFAQLCKDFKVNQVFSQAHSPWIQGQIEKANRSLKDLLMTGMVQRNDKRWVIYLDICLENYNSRIHSSIKMSPLEATESKDTEGIKELLEKKRVVHKSATEFKVGDFVRIPSKLLPENKGNTFFKSIYRWTKDKWIVTRRIKSGGENITSYLIRNGDRSLVVSPFNMLLAN